MPKSGNPYIAMLPLAFTYEKMFLFGLGALYMQGAFALREAMRFFGYGKREVASS